MRSAELPTPRGGWDSGWSEIDITFHEPHRNPRGPFHIAGPKVEIDGHEVPASWRDGLIRVPAGSRHVKVWLPYPKFGAFGTANHVVDVPPGQTVRLEYRPPFVPGMKGALGPSPQRSPGCALALIPLLIVAVCLCCGIFTEVVKLFADS